MFFMKKILTLVLKMKSNNKFISNKMKITLLSFSFLIIAFNPVIITAQIFSNPITGTNPNLSNPYTTGQTVSADVTASGIGRGTGITGSSANDRYNATGWNSAALDANDYFEWTITPVAGKAINFLNLVYTSQASGTGATTFSLRSSNDAFASSIASPVAAGGTINISALSNISSAITFRLYGWGASASTGTFSINDFTFSANVVLGVELKDIIISKNNTSTKLTWQTATEQNNSHFSVERSQDGFAFDKIGEVKGAGTSTKAKDYNFVDNAPMKGTNYYQLRQVDFDGKETISKTVAVNFDGKVGKAKVYPTVVKDMLTVELASDVATDISVRDVTGRVILSKNTEGAFSTTLDLGAAANGLYFITVQSNQGLETIKVLKQ